MSTAAFHSDIVSNKYQQGTANRGPQLSANFNQEPAIVYRPIDGIDVYVRAVCSASPRQIVDIECRGVQGRFIQDVSVRMNLATARCLSFLGVSRATAEKQSAAGESIKGRGARSAIALIKILALAQEAVESNAAQFPGVDAARWLGQWLERPQPALNGRKPADLMDTFAGAAMVTRLLASDENTINQRF